MRWRILKSLVALFVGFIVGFVVVHFMGVTEILVRPIRPFLMDTQDGRLAAFGPLTAFFLELKLSLIVGFLLAFPVIAYQIWSHLSPALDRDQRRVIIPSLYMGLVLFAMGVVVAYLIIPLSLRFLFAFQQDYLNLVIGANEYLAFVVRLLVAFGVVFELPVVIMILTTLGLVTPMFLADKRRHAIVGITVLSSLVTPGDLASTFMMMIPMIILYELSIFLSRAIYRRRWETDEEREARLRGAGADAPEEAVEVGS